MSSFVKNSLATIMSLTSLNLEDLIEDRQELVRLCNIRRLNLYEAPSQSNFRVFCFLIIEYGKEATLDIIEGTNSESSYIGGSICAERAALMQLRHLESPIIRKIVIVTDSRDTISPGLLCREYLMSNAVFSTPIVLGNCDGTIIQEIELGQLYPYPSIYRCIHRSKLTNFGLNFASKCISHKDHSNMAICAIFDAASACNNFDRLDSLHPLRYSAAVRYADGSIQCAWMMKGVEYGCSLDPISQLVSSMERQRHGNGQGTGLGLVLGVGSAGVWDDVYMVMVDQYGIAHAPFAQARALLVEHGYGAVKVVIHEEADGGLAIVAAKDLVPDGDGGDTHSLADMLMSHFRTSGS